MNLPCVFSWHQSYAWHNARQVGSASYSRFTQRVPWRIGKRLTGVIRPSKIQTIEALACPSLRAIAEDAKAKMTAIKKEADETQ